MSIGVRSRGRLPSPVSAGVLRRLRRRVATASRAPDRAARRRRARRRVVQSTVVFFVGSAPAPAARSGLGRLERVGRVEVVRPQRELRRRAELRRERVLDRGGLVAEARVDRACPCAFGAPNTMTPSSMPIGCASWTPARTGAFSIAERRGPRLDHVVERERDLGAVGAPGAAAAPVPAPAGRDRFGRRVGLRRRVAPGEQRAAAVRARGAVGRGRCRGRCRARARRRPASVRAARPDRAASPRACALRGARGARPRPRARGADRRWPGRGCRRSPARASRSRARARRCPSRLASSASRSASSAGPSYGTRPAAFACRNASRNVRSRSSATRRGS